MKSVRADIGGLGNLMFKQAFLWAQLREGNIPDVYLQSEKYWKKYEHEIRAMFSSGIGHDDRVALHIRRGDYLKAAEFHVQLWQTDYYQKALALFPDETFLVFCRDRQDPEIDKADREWVKEFMAHLGITKYELADYPTETEELNAMASCKSVIMANSSFSWWGAWLGRHDKVICPSQWFTDGLQRTDLLDSWVQI